MAEILYDEVPSLDLADFTSGDPKRKAKFVNDLGTAYNNIGFVAIRNHYLTDELSAKLYSCIKKFFAMPDASKQQYEIAGLAGQRGYIGKGKEHAKGRNTGDLKEFYHVGQEVLDSDPIKQEYPDNVWPSEIPEFKEIALEVYQRLEKTGVQMLRAIALYLNLPEDYFDKKVHHGNSILRPIHYFPIENPDAVPADAVRAAEHGDINLITLLMGASADGLQVRLTNKKLKSTIHRVVNPPRDQMNKPRYSIPFFMHPRSEMNLAALPSCVDAEHPKLWADITAGEFLNQRLREIGLKK
jgi:isopenicillin N synthase-like dioxygenase